MERLDRGLGSYEAISFPELRAGNRMGSFGSAEADRLERLDDSSFSDGRLSRGGTWAVAFLADWCPFCRRFAPGFAGLAADGARLAIADVSSDESPLWERFSIEVIPTVLLFREGSVVARFDGRPAEGLGPADLRRLRAAIDSLPSG